MPKPKVPYKPSPAGPAVYPWINKADTKYNTDGVYKVGILAEGPEALAYKEYLDHEAERAFAEETEDMAPAERKKWRIYVPYEVEENEDGTPTGRIQFNFKQNAVINVEGVAKPIQIAIFDASDKEVHTKIFGGSVLRVMARPRNTKIAASKQAGVKLDFLKVQIVKLAEYKQESGFGAVEGGYVADPDEEKAHDFEGSDEAPADDSAY